MTDSTTTFANLVLHYLDKVDSCAGVSETLRFKAGTENAGSSGSVAFSDVSNTTDEIEDEDTSNTERKSASERAGSPHPHLPHSDSNSLESEALDTDSEHEDMADSSRDGSERSSLIDLNTRAAHAQAMLRLNEYENDRIAFDRKCLEINLHNRFVFLAMLERERAKRKKDPGMFLDAITKQEAWLADRERLLAERVTKSGNEDEISFSTLAARTTRLVDSLANGETAINARNEPMAQSEARTEDFLRNFLEQWLALAEREKHTPVRCLTIKNTIILCAAAIGVMVCARLAYLVWSKALLFAAFLAF